jgi:hypothetical protein
MYHWIPDEGRRGGSPHKSIPRFWDAKAVAAHRNSILLRFLFPKNTGTFPDKSEEFFVYQTALQTLTKLPTPSCISTPRRTLVHFAVRMESSLWHRHTSRSLQEDVAIAG